MKITARNGQKEFPTLEHRKFAQISTCFPADGLKLAQLGIQFTERVSGR